MKPSSVLLPGTLIVVEHPEPQSLDQEIQYGFRNIRLSHTLLGESDNAILYSTHLRSHSQHREYATLENRLLTHA